ncbi:SpaH/EbpB family LPXTG-anchored major pilin [Streptococcus ovuberis]|uniref:SpaH/EbpB family LPXTG-anchored major pilin n=1 Tax=Streptococcus ovuberis TaxID=1936207 RepID=A0A7X6MZT5_9STRE|nr:SpaH/EbpB family LPXTG-anchored major pilin [Streptococcus ovuberis]NKZ20886.1 SpaH/EbpB family LPXTG-anchored major pilin [Streptococcus ovuberis]
MKKKIIKSILAAMLILGTVAPATAPVFAAGPGSIEIKNTQQNTEYKAYKIFDATNDGDAVSYTLPKDNPLLKTQSFTELFDTTTNGDLTYIMPKTGVTPEKITKWAQTLKEQLPAVATITETGTDSTETLSVDYGYYLVDSSLDQGSVIMVTSATPNAIIHEKESKPTWGDPNSGAGKKTDKKTYNIGDEITYTVTYTNATNFNGGNKVYQYVMEDNMPEATVIELVKGSIEVKVNDNALTKSDVIAKGNYKLEENGNDFKLIIPWAASQAQTADAQLGKGDDFFYDKGVNVIEVTYKGILKSGATEGSSAQNTNIARIYPNDVPDSNDPGQSVNVYDGEIKIKKVDGIEKTKVLEGAQFVLRRKDNQLYYKFDESTQKTSWESEQSQATVKVTGKDGGATFTGLAEGEYELIETVAPKGYNVLKDPISVTLAFKEGATGTDDTLIATPEIKNNSGAELPSTGSFGTKLLYIVGTTLVIVAGVTLVARRRAEN